MDNHKKLLESQIFRAALFTPVVIGAALLCVTAYFNSNYSACFSSDCINNFFTLYKFPLSIMGIGVPLSAIAAAIHRSEETSLQIRTSQHQLDETLKQNKFNNYIKHKEEFLELLEKIEVLCNCKFSDPLQLYKQIFPKNSYHNVSFIAHCKDDSDHIPNTFLTELKSELWDFVNILYNEKSDSSEYTDAIFTIHNITTTLKLSRSPDTYSTGSKILIWPDNFASTSFDHIKHIIRSFTSFSSYEEPSNEKRDNALRLMRREGSGHVRQHNLLGIDNLSSGIDDFLFD
jgi:hypothetical protein